MEVTRNGSPPFLATRLLAERAQRGADAYRRSVPQRDPRKPRRQRTVSASSLPEQLLSRLAAAAAGNGTAGMALAFFSVRACHMQIRPQYRKTRLTVLIGGVIYIATAAARNVLLAPARVADRFHNPSRYSPGSGRNGLCLGFRAETRFGQCGAADLDAGQRPLGAAANSIMTSPWLKRIPPCAAA